MSVFGSYMKRTKKNSGYVPTEKYGKLSCRFAPEVLVPSNAIDGSFFLGAPADRYIFTTMDGHKCLGTFLASWKNSEDGHNDELQDFCMERFKCGFGTIRAIMASRLGKVEDYWHLIKLEEICA